MSHIIEQYKADKKALRDYAEKVRELHYWCASHENSTISFYTHLPYRTTQTALKQAIARGWPTLTPDEVGRVYDIWSDCNEDIAYCVERFVSDKLDIWDEGREQLELAPLTDEERKQLKDQYLG